MKVEHPIKIRRAKIEDLRGIMDIKNYYINHTYALWRKQKLSMEEMLLWWGVHSPTKYPIIVAAEWLGDQERIIGYACLSVFREAEGYKYTAENSIYLYPGYEGKGVARALMKAALDIGVRAGLRIVTAWVDSENSRSVAFHEALGFEKIGVMRNVGMLDGKSRSVTILDLDLLAGSKMNRN